MRVGNDGLILYQARLNVAADSKWWLGWVARRLYARQKVSPSADTCLSSCQGGELVLCRSKGHLKLHSLKGPSTVLSIVYSYRIYDFALRVGANVVFTGGSSSDSPRLSEVKKTSKRTYDIKR